MDKTGTITKGNFIVQDIVPSANYTAAEVLQAAAACETASTHPIGTSILLAAKEQDLSLENPAQLEEISGKGIHARLSCGDVLCGSRKLLTEFNVDCGTYDENGAVTTVYVAINGTFAGTIQISDTIKPEAKDAIRTLKSMGIRSAMLTGDGEAAAEAVADAVGIDHVTQSFSLPTNWKSCRNSAPRAAARCSSAMGSMTHRFSQAPTSELRWAVVRMPRSRLLMSYL